MIRAEVLNRVNNGVELLDEVYGRQRWLAAVDPGELALADCEKCVVGQLVRKLGFGALDEDTRVPDGQTAEATEWQRWIKAAGWYVGDTMDVASQYAFDRAWIAEVGIDITFDQLDEAWQYKLAQLRAES